MNHKVEGIAFDMYGTVVDVGAVEQACREVAPDPEAFNRLWRDKQIEYTFLRSLMGRYEDFWRVTEDALEFSLEHYSLKVTADQRRKMMEAWLEPTPYPEVSKTLPEFSRKLPLAILSNGSPRMLETGLERTALRKYFRWVLSVDQVRVYKPAKQVYGLLPDQMGMAKEKILFVSSNPFDVIGAKSFGFPVCWIKRTRTGLDPLGFEPDLVVENFEQLVESIEQWNS